MSVSGTNTSPNQQRANQVGDEHNAEAVLSVRSLSKSFGGLVAVSNVSFDVAKAELLALIGPNGAGKTTCLLSERTL